MMTIDEMIAVLTAYKEGKTIQSATKGEDNWKTTVPPCWDFDMFDYRIKPEEPKPKYRPYESAEEVLEAIKEHGGYVKEGSIYRYLKKFTVMNNGEIVYSFSGWNSSGVRDWEEVSKYVTWPDGTPFGVKEEEK